jgi:hypothetical protein
MASGIRVITRTGMTTAAAAQTCESRILARADADNPGVRGGAEAIADLGPAIPTPSSAGDEVD